MIKNHIHLVIKANKLSLDDLSGKRYFYNKTRCLIALISKLVLVCASIFLIIVADKPGAFSLGIFLTILLFYSLLGTISVVLLKNPLFILDKDKFYYVITNKWYNVKKCTLHGDSQYAFSWHTYLAIYSNDGNRIIQEANWLIKDVDRFKGVFRYNQLK